MKKITVCIRAVVMAALLVVLVYVPLLVVKGILKILYLVFLPLPKEKPKWIGAMVHKLGQFYNDYLSF